MSSCVTCGRVHLDPHTEDYDPPDDPAMRPPLSDHEGEGDLVSGVSFNGSGVPGFEPISARSGRWKTSRRTGYSKRLKIVTSTRGFPPSRGRFSKKRL